ncbi:hypothetical protein I4641_00150 [Waterburya agarophytonicola K14]|uniref:Uncharacterized protein n=1 Tax=Waterburya agarophytonicola KI4 TaxID=2874699 RepID=A0A964FDS6_9CYAN|nr:hypothetical protein [Waterburya agarophytonicola]MCC0175391.1 hypothetical protein [Waterburya agarophytonicola KI4]
MEILLESENVLGKRKCLALIKKILTESQESKIDSIKVYGRKKQEHFPEWTTELTISNKVTVNITELAQKRNIESIIAVLYGDLNTNAIDVKASWKDDCLRITLVSEKELSPKFASTIKNKIFDLDIENCKKIRICSQLTNDDFPDWLEEFNKEKFQSPEITRPSVAISSTASKLALLNKEMLKQLLIL